MITFCPYCEKEVIAQKEEINETISIRNELIEVSVNSLHCSICNNIFNDPDLRIDVLEIAYRKYRSIHGMIQPEKIKNFRTSLGLTQVEFSKLVGIGTATLSRYENGSLQDAAHENLLNLIMDPTNLINLVKENEGLLPPYKIKSIINGMEFSIHQSAFDNFEANFAEFISINSKPDITHGFVSFSFEKIINAILFFCKDVKIPKTKINKLMFYLDFKHFKEYSVGITGHQYIHLPYGPIFDQFDPILAYISSTKNYLNAEETIFADDIIGTLYTTIVEPNLSVFSEIELSTLLMIKEKFRDQTAKAISEQSHKESAYIQTVHKEVISYLYATDLKI